MLHFVIRRTINITHFLNEKKLKEKLKLCFKEMASTWLSIKISMSGRYLKHRYKTKGHNFLLLYGSSIETSGRN